MLTSDADPLLQPEGLAKEGTTLASDSDPLLRPEGLAKEGTTLAFDCDPLFRSEGLAKEGTTLASDFDPLFRPGIRRTSAYSSSPTGTVGTDWERPTEDARLRTPAR